MVLVVAVVVAVFAGFISIADLLWLLMFGILTIALCPITAMALAVSLAVNISAVVMIAFHSLSCRNRFVYGLGSFHEPAQEGCKPPNRRRVLMPHFDGWVDLSTVLD